MEEIENKKFEITEEHWQFPRVFSIKNTTLNYENKLRVIESPLNNCQTFSIGNAYRLGSFGEENIIEFFKLIYKLLGRKQMIIDLKDECNDSVIKSISHIISNKYSQKYESTNGSTMHLHIIQLDITKLK